MLMTKIGNMYHKTADDRVFTASWYICSMIDRIVLTSAAGSVGETVRRSLESHGAHVTVFEGPDARKDTVGFIRELRRMVNDSGPVILLPVFFPEVLADHRDMFPECLIPLDQASKIRLLDNKLSACDLAESLGIPQPRRFEFNDGDLEFPAVFKRTTGQGGDSVYFPRDRKALANLIRTSCEYLITEFVEGENWCTDCLRTGKSFRAASYRVLEPQGKGISTKREAVEAPELEEYCRKLLDAVDYHGVCGMDFRRSPDGRFHFLECNPRFSGGIETTLESGFDIVWEYIQSILSEPLSRR